MYRFLLPVFVILPIVEVWLLIAVGREIGLLPTVLAVIATAIIGVYWLRMQGLATLMRFQERLVERQLPTTEIVEGVLLIVAGAFLLTPGFATDFVGFSLLVPRLRRWFAAQLKVLVVPGVQTAEMDHAAEARTNHERFRGAGQAKGSGGSSDDPVVIEGEYTREDR